ncbi:MAG: response regulator transcription factor [Anaerolineae bacterium]
MNPVTVAVHGRTPIDQAALSALLASLPGLAVLPLTAVPPPRVLLCHDQPPECAPETAVLCLLDNADELPQSLDVAGLFAADETPAALAAAVRQVARGEQYLSPSLALAWIKRQQVETTPQAANLDALTRREQGILALLGEGLSNKAIAARLYLSVRTIEGHIANLYAKLGVHSRTEAALIAVQNQVILPG